MRFSFQKFPAEAPSTAPAAPRNDDELFHKIYAALRPYPEAHAAVLHALAPPKEQAQPGLA